MAIRRFYYNYSTGDAEVSFLIDDSIFTKDMAIGMLEFFTWDYDKEADPIDEIMKKIAIKCISIATAESYNVYGVISEFEDLEGFARLDGSAGILLIDIAEYEFEERDLDLKISETTKEEWKKFENANHEQY